MKLGRKYPKTGVTNCLFYVHFIITHLCSPFQPSDIIDPAVLRPGRMDKILYVGIPPPQDRVAILNTITKVNDLCKLLGPHGQKFVRVKLKTWSIKTETIFCR